MLPVITLVGRPNVGKSTLFNRLTRTRDALVANFPGLTRDRQYGHGRVGPKPYLIVDTGGISGEQDGVEAHMDAQVQRAIDEADHVLFMVDARDGVTGSDMELAQSLRRLGRPLTLVANKIDHLDENTATAELHGLGLGDPVAIAATQGRGVRSLMDQVLGGIGEVEVESDNDNDNDNDNEQDGAEISPADKGGDGIQIAVVGRPNVGKSTLINRILGEERLIAFDSPGTTRDSIHVPFEHLGKRYTLIDTAGMRRRARIDQAIEKFSVIKTLQAIDASNVVILVLDAQQGISEQDATIASHVVESGRALVVAVNKWDGLDRDLREKIRADVQRKVGFLDFAAMHFISALHGSGVGLLLNEVEKAYKSAMRDLPTPELTRVLEACLEEHQPPLVRGRRIKLRYAHQGGRNPPIVVIHGNQTDNLPDSYRRYLINRFREAFKLHGTPLRLELKSGDNPFAGRRNTLTPRQQRSRDRLKKHVKKPKKR